MRVLREDTSAILIDVQEKLMPHIFEKDQVTERIITLIKGLEVLKIPVFVSEQYRKGLGVTIASVKEALGDSETIEKLSFSCLDQVQFREKFSPAAKKNVIVAGVETHVCVLQTALDLLADGYTPVLVKDCVSSRKEMDKKTAIKRMQAEGAIITTCESILFELCRFADNDSFKAISKLVK